MENLELNFKAKFDDGKVHMTSDQVHFLLIETEIATNISLRTKNNQNYNESIV